MKTGSVSGAVCVVALMASAPLDATAQDVATAQALFDRGRAALLAGKYEAACPALAESHRLEPRAGALFSLAECEARWGKLATAMAHYADYVAQVGKLPDAQQAQQLDRVTYAQEQRARLAPLVPLLTLRIPPDAPPGTTLSRDGTRLGPAALGVALPVDPGEHVVSLRTPDGRASELRLSIPTGERREVTPPSPPAAARATTGVVVDPAPERPKPARGLSPGWGYAAGGLGLAGVAAGTVAGVLALQKKSVVAAHCAAGLCDPEGLDAVHAGRAMGTASDVSFTVGVVGLVTAAVLLWRSSSNEAPPAASWRPALSAAQREAWAGVERTF